MKYDEVITNKEDYIPDVADRVARLFDEFDGLQRFIDTYDDNKDVLTPEDYAKAIKLAIRYARQYFLDYSHLSITKLQPTDSLNEPENGYVKDKDTFYRMPFIAKPTRFLVSDGLPY